MLKCYSDATAGQAEKLIGAGAHAYLTKPFSVEQLLAAIDAALPPLAQTRTASTTNASQ